jgi:hypothetical protein
MRNKGKRAPTWRVTTVAVLKISFHAERRISVGLMSQDHYQVPRAGQQSRQATRGCTLLPSTIRAGSSKACSRRHGCTRTGRSSSMRGEGRLRRATIASGRRPKRASGTQAVARVRVAGSFSQASATLNTSANAKARVARVSRWT